MYTDPALIRKHKLKISLNDNEAALLDAICRFTGQEKAALVRELMLEAAAEILHADQCAVPVYALRGAQQAVLQA